MKRRTVFLSLIGTVMLALGGTVIPVTAATPPPTLNGEKLQTLGASSTLGVPPASMTVTSDCTANPPTITWVIRNSMHGVPSPFPYPSGANGPYTGSYSEIGRAWGSNPTPPPIPPIPAQTAFVAATFEINSPTGTVHGFKTGMAHGFECHLLGSTETGVFVGELELLSYHAEIQSPDGSKWSDSGTTDLVVHNPSLAFRAHTENYTSSQATTTPIKH